MKIGPENIAHQGGEGQGLKDFITNEHRAWADYDGVPLMVTVDGIRYIVFCKSHFERDNGWKQASDYIATHEAHRGRVRKAFPTPFVYGRSISEMLMGSDKSEPGHFNYEAVNHPDHYNKHPSGVECIDVVEHMGFNLGNVVKYLWRMGDKPGVDDLEDLKKARWYLDREIQRIEKKGESQ